MTLPSDAACIAHSVAHVVFKQHPSACAFGFIGSLASDEHELQLVSLAMQLLQLVQMFTHPATAALHIMVAHSSQVRMPVELELATLLEDDEASELDDDAASVDEADVVDAALVVDATVDPGPLVGPGPDAGDPFELVAFDTPPVPRSSPVESRLHANGSAESTGRIKKARARDMNASYRHQSR